MKQPITSKNIVASINRTRKEEGRRILWPDYEVYDLLDQGVPLRELQAHTSTVPAIFCLGNGEDTAQLKQTKQYTHIAVCRKWVLSQDLEPEPQFWAVATKRGMAVDLAEVKRSLQTQTVWMEVVQLNAQVHLWGVHLCYHNSPPALFGPSYIRQKSHTWFVQISSQQPVRSVVLYGTHRPPVYNRVQPYKELPKYSSPQFAMNCRQFPGYVASLHSEETLKQLASSTPLRFGKPRHSSRFMQSEKDKEVETKKDVEPPQKVSLITEASHKSASKQSQKPSKLRVSKLVGVSEVQADQSPQPTLPEMLDSMKNIAANYLSLLQTLWKTQGQDLQQLNEMVRKFKQDSFQIKLAKIAKASQARLPAVMVSYFFCELILSFCSMPAMQQKKKSWFRLMNEASEQRQNLVVITVHVLWDLLFQNHHLMRDMQRQQLDEIAQLGQQKFPEMLERALATNCGQPAALCDYLLVLMQFKRLKNIMELYRHSPLNQAEVYVHCSINDWLESHKIPLDAHSDIVYQVSMADALKSTLIPQSSEPKRDVINESITLTTKIKMAQADGIWCSRSFDSYHNRFKLIVLRQSGIITYFIEEQCPVEKAPSDPNRVHSYNIGLKISMGDDFQHSHTFGHNFCNGARAVGGRLEDPGFESIQVRLKMSRQVAHEAVVNYMRVRVVEMARLQTQSQKSKQRLSSRLQNKRSSFMLQKEVQEQLERLELDSLPLEEFVKSEWCRQEDSIYQFDLCDMFSLVLAGCFETESQALGLVLRYALVRKCTQDQFRLLIACLRVHLIPMKQLLWQAEQASIRGHTQALSLLKQVIQLRRNSQASPKNSPSVYPFARSPLDHWLHHEQDYSVAYLSYLRTTARPQ